MMNRTPFVAKKRDTTAAERFKPPVRVIGNWRLLKSIGAPYTLFKSFLLGAVDTPPLIVWSALD
jgi:hypothetical protein